MNKLKKKEYDRNKTVNSASQYTNFPHQIAKLFCWQNK